MAELTPSDRLQPCLLDRLTDGNPESAKEGRDERVISLRRYEQAVRRDLEWLLNANAHPEADGLHEYNEVLRSVLNYGIPDMCGSTASSLNPEELQRQLVEAIRTFEPRIMPGTLSVNVIARFGTMDRRTVSFEIQGELWAEPISDHLFIPIEIDLETGECQVVDRANG